MSIRCGNDLFKSGMVTGLNLADTIREAKEFDFNRGSLIDQASLVNRLMILSLNVTEISALVTNQDQSVLDRLKHFDCLSNDINVPLQLFKGICNLDFTLPGVVNFLDQAIVAPLSQAVYTHSEQNRSAIQTFLNEHGHELGDKRSVVEKELVACQRAADQALQVRLLSKVVSTTTSSAAVQARYNQLAEQFALAFEPEEIEEEESFSLLNLTYIPEALHEAFQEYQCPITLCPMRDPVRDPTATGQNPVYYERSAIVNHLQIDARSPITRKPLTVAQLVNCPELKAAIETRLDQFQTELMDFLEQRAATIGID